MQLEPIHDTTPLNVGRDLTKPAELHAELCELAGGLEQEAMASRSGSALAGNPHPEFFFLRCVRALRAAAVTVAPPAPEKKEKKPAAAG